MNVSTRYSDRATAYSQWRWTYAPEAIAEVMAACALSSHAAVADIGAGNGLLARHFVNRVRTVFAVEPNPQMRRLAEKALGRYAAFRSIAGSAEATTLPRRSVHLITVGRALHWFRSGPTKTELNRILAPGGWLAVFSTPCTDRALVESLGAVFVGENGWDEAFDKRRRPRVPLSHYFGHDRFRTLVVEGAVEESWEAFLGRCSSMAGAPGVDHPRRAKFEQALRRTFDERADHGVLRVSNATHVSFGPLVEHGSGPERALVDAEPSGRPRVGSDHLLGT